MTKVFIDGSAGTTGLRIVDRLSTRQDLSLVILPEELRKDPEARADALKAADVAFLCLPDDAARQSASLAQGSSVKIIDTSTAHRTDPDWVYGMPELTGLREKIASSSRSAGEDCFFLPDSQPRLSRQWLYCSGCPLGGAGNFEKGRFTLRLFPYRLFRRRQENDCPV